MLSVLTLSLLGGPFVSGIGLHKDSPWSTLVGLFQNTSSALAVREENPALQTYLYPNRVCGSCNQQANFCPASATSAEFVRCMGVYDNFVDVTVVQIKSSFAKLKKLERRMSYVCNEFEKKGEKYEKKLNKAISVADDVRKAKLPYISKAMGTFKKGLEAAKNAVGILRVVGRVGCTIESLVKPITEKKKIIFRTLDVIDTATDVVKGYAEARCRIHNELCIWGRYSTCQFSNHMLSFYDKACRILPSLQFNVDLSILNNLLPQIDVAINLIDNIPMPDWSILDKILELIETIKDKICSTFKGFCDVWKIVGNIIGEIENFVKDLIRRINPNLDIEQLLQPIIDALKIGLPINLSFWNGISVQIPNINVAFDIGIKNFLSLFYTINFPLDFSKIFQCEIGVAAGTLKFDYSCNGPEICSTYNFDRQVLSCGDGYRVNVFSGLHFEVHNISLPSNSSSASEYVDSLMNSNKCQVPVNFECDSDVAIQCTGRKTCTYVPPSSLSSNFPNCGPDSALSRHFFTVSACKDERYWNAGIGVSDVAKYVFQDDVLGKILPKSLGSSSSSSSSSSKLTCQNGFHIVLGGAYGNSGLYPEPLRKECNYKKECTVTWQLAQQIDLKTPFAGHENWLNPKRFCPSQWMYDHRSLHDPTDVDRWFCNACNCQTTCPNLQHCDLRSASCCVKDSSGPGGDLYGGFISSALIPYGRPSPSDDFRKIYYRCVSDETVPPLDIQMIITSLDRQASFPPDWPQSKKVQFTGDKTLLPPLNTLSCASTKARIHIRSAVFQNIDRMTDVERQQYGGNMRDLEPRYQDNPEKMYRDLLVQDCEGKESCQIDFPLRLIGELNWLAYAYDCLCPAGTFYDETKRSCANCPKRMVSEGDNKGCRFCSPGLMPSANQSLCEVCKPGYQIPVEDHPEECEPCGPGHYQDQWNQTTCKPCPPGQYQDTNNATTCKLCPKGTYASSQGTVACEPARLDYYVPSAGMNHELQCPDGYGTSILGAHQCYSKGHLLCMGMETCIWEGPSGQNVRCGNPRLIYNKVTKKCQACAVGQIGDAKRLKCVPEGSYTLHPTKYPTTTPTNEPSKFPTKFPTPQPTVFPTPFPTPNPTQYPVPFSNEPIVKCANSRGLGAAEMMKRLEERSGVIEHKDKKEGELDVNTFNKVLSGKNHGHSPHSHSPHSHGVYRGRSGSLSTSTSLCNGYQYIGFSCPKKHGSENPSWDVFCLNQHDVNIFPAINVDNCKGKPWALPNNGDSSNHQCNGLNNGVYWSNGQSRAYIDQPNALWWMGGWGRMTIYKIQYPATGFPTPHPTPNPTPHPTKVPVPPPMPAPTDYPTPHPTRAPTPTNYYAPVTCRLTIDNTLTHVYVNGVELPVFGDKLRWDRTKTISFDAVRVTRLAVTGHDSEVNGCQTGGLAITCKSSASSVWDGLTSSIQWRATSTKPASISWTQAGVATPGFGDPCVSPSGFFLPNAFTPSYTKIFAHGAGYRSDAYMYIEKTDSNLGECRSRASVTCKLTVDNRLTGVWVNGIKQVIGGGDVGHWNQVKTISFDATRVTRLAVTGFDGEPNGCQTGGLGLTCSSSVSSTWDSITSSTKWRVRNSLPESSWIQPGGSDAGFVSPCVSPSGFFIPGAIKPYTKIFAPGTPMNQDAYMYIEVVDDSLQSNCGFGLNCPYTEISGNNWCGPTGVSITDESSDSPVGNLASEAACRAVCNSNKNCNFYLWTPPVTQTQLNGSGWNTTEERSAKTYFCSTWSSCVPTPAGDAVLYRKEPTGCRTGLY